LVPRFREFKHIVEIGLPQGIARDTAGMKTPDFLGRVGLAKWRELRERLGDIKPPEWDSLALLAASWEDYLSARSVIDAEGRYLKSHVNGRSFIQPAINDRNEAWKQIVKLSKAFGLQPEARQLEVKHDMNQWEGLLGDELP
jgi:P27 family predicted phage terminase small subunit